jgi:hypothetical protein
MKQERRWLKSVLEASREPLPALPWARGERRKPAALQTPRAPQGTRPTLAAR